MRSAASAKLSTETGWLSAASAPDTSRSAGAAEGGAPSVELLSTSTLPLTNSCAEAPEVTVTREPLVRRTYAREKRPPGSASVVPSPTESPPLTRCGAMTGSEVSSALSLLLAAMASLAATSYPHSHGRGAGLTVWCAPTDDESS